MGGSETYARAIAGQLAKTSAVAATAYLPASAAGSGEGLPERIISGLPSGHSTTDRLRTMAALTRRGPALRRLMGESDVVHFPFTVPAPRPARRQATVQSLHDLQHLDLPRLFSRAELLYRRSAYEGFARKADAVVTISHFAKSRMIDLLGLDAEKIHVAHLGVDSARFTPNLGERENFVLYPARGWAHKNHGRLIEAMTIARTTNPTLRLVLTGGGLDSLGVLPDWVDRRGLVPEEELTGLFRAAGVLAFPSLYEGFGLPPLEAMASGCPVAASNAGSIPEVVGDAAVLFDPLSPESIADGILQALADAPRLSALGVAHAATFTWENCLDAHLLAYAAAARTAEARR
nr:glycosyltransferase family 1 protein [Leifsonia flava]